MQRNLALSSADFWPPHTQAAHTGRLEASSWAVGRAPSAPAGAAARSSHAVPPGPTRPAHAAIRSVRRRGGAAHLLLEKKARVLPCPPRRRKVRASVFDVRRAIDNPRSCLNHLRLPVDNPAAMGRWQARAASASRQSRSSISGRPGTRLTVNSGTEESTAGTERARDTCPRGAGG